MIIQVIQVSAQCRKRKQLITSGVVQTGAAGTHSPGEFPCIDDGKLMRLELQKKNAPPKQFHAITFNLITSLVASLHIVQLIA